MFYHRPLFGLLLLFSWILPYRPPLSHATAQRATLPAGAGSETTAPFREGERLDYEVGWNNFLTAATARLAVKERRQFYGREAWHFQAAARTVEPVRILYPLDDQFDSYSEVDGLHALQFEMYIRELGKKEDTVARISREGDTWPTASDGRNSSAQPIVRLPAGTRDALGLLYFLRTADWTRTKEMRVPVYDGRKLYEVRAWLERMKGDVIVPAGNYSASRIALTIFDRGRERTDVRIWIWLGHDAARTPVLIEAELPFGTVRVELSRAG